MKQSDFINILKKTFDGVMEDNITFISASLAYYTTFSLVPLFVICIYIAGLFFGKEMVTDELVNHINRSIGSSSALQIKMMISQFMYTKTSTINKFISTIVLIFGATGVFGALQTGLNLVWHVKPKADKGIVGFIKDRFLSFMMVGIISFLLLISLLTTVIIGIASSNINNYFASGELIGLGLNFLISTAIITILFSMMFKYLPDVQIKWADVWLGAFITTLLFTIGTFLIGMYFKYLFENQFGAASSLVLILVWVFYSAHIFFIGAEFTKAFATRNGRSIIPSKSADLLIITKN